MTFCSLRSLNQGPRPPDSREYSVGFIAVVTFMYIVGIVGNAAALWILTKKESKRTRKIGIMLTFLALNDLVALVGMFVFFYLKTFLSIKEDLVSVSRPLGIRNDLIQRCKKLSQKERKIYYILCSNGCAY